MVNRNSSEGRIQKLDAATTEAKHALRKSKSWTMTREHMRYWLKAKYALARRTTNDYLDDIAARLMLDPEFARYIQATQREGQTA